MDKRELVRLAFEAREASYSPYSNFQVGAAILCDDGSVYTGCNIENASYGAAICAERTAAVKAVSEGKRIFKAVAVVGSPKGAGAEDFQYAYPCGICRQFLREFCNPADMQVYVARSPEDIKENTLEDLLPDSFGPGDLL